MKQILQNARTGELEFSEVPAPALGANQVLVRNLYSVMSPGTEKLTLEFARASLVTKARNRPDLVKQVLHKMRQDGPLATYRTAMTRLEAPQPMGYSCAGVVEAVGDRVTGFQAGDRVACAGAGYANHAELVVVPENLVALVPDGVPLEYAAFSTIGAIALQGVRIAQPTLGETAAVIGLGLIGQLAVQLLVANGCRVVGIDLDERRTQQGKAQGAEWVGSPAEINEAWKERETGGMGVDFAVVTASSESAAPLQYATELCRHKGRVAVVGAMPLELERRTMYDKELEVRMSTSYGPGRYDRTYEEVGLDYPLPYVRWTENRNLSAFLNLIQSNALRPESLDVQTLPIGDAIEAYDDLASGKTGSLAVVFQYDEDVSRDRTLRIAPEPPAKRQHEVGVGFIGAGNYAKAVLLPLLDKQREIQRLTLVTATGASAKKTAQKFRFSGCSTDPQALYLDPNIDLVFITTRHDTHADLAIEAMEQGKAVWLEKPIALTREDTTRVIGAARELGAFLMVGYNRRFSPHAQAARELFAKRSGPLAIHYVVSPGAPARGTWITDPAEGGGRIIGENCHFVDLINYLVGDGARSVYSRSLGSDPEADDSMITMLTYPDGSTATLEYLANADDSLPKERFEASADGLSASCNNFRVTTLSGRRDVKGLNQDKGQAEAIAQVLQALRAGQPSPITLEDLEATSMTTFAMLESAARGVPVDVAG